MCTPVRYSASLVVFWTSSNCSCFTRIFLSLLLVIINQYRNLAMNKISQSIRYSLGKWYVFYGWGLSYVVLLLLSFVSGFWSWISEWSLILMERKRQRREASDDLIKQRWPRIFLFHILQVFYYNRLRLWLWLWLWHNILW